MLLFSSSRNKWHCELPLLQVALPPSSLQHVLELQCVVGFSSYVVLGRVVRYRSRPCRAHAAVSVLLCCGSLVDAMVCFFARVVWHPARPSSCLCVPIGGPSCRGVVELCDVLLFVPIVESPSLRCGPASSKVFCRVPRSVAEFSPSTCDHNARQGERRGRPGVGEMICGRCRCSRCCGSAMCPISVQSKPIARGIVDLCGSWLFPMFGEFCCVGVLGCRRGAWRSCSGIVSRPCLSRWVLVFGCGAVSLRRSPVRRTPAWSRLPSSQCAPVHWLRRPSRLCAVIPCVCGGGVNVRPVPTSYMTAWRCLWSLLCVVVVVLWPCVVFLCMAGRLCALVRLRGSAHFVCSTMSRVECELGASRTSGGRTPFVPRSSLGVRIRNHGTLALAAEASASTPCPLSSRHPQESTRRKTPPGGHRGRATKICEARPVAMGRPFSPTGARSSNKGCDPSGPTTHRTPMGRSHG